MDTEKLKAWLAAKGLELSEDELAALTSVDQVRALAGERGIEVSEDELAELEPAETPIDEEAKTEAKPPIDEEAKTEAKPPIDEEAKTEAKPAEAKPAEPMAPAAPAAPAGPSPELEAALARIAALEGEIAGYQQRETEAATERTRLAAEGVLTARQVKPKFIKTVTRELEGQDLTSDAGKAALDALLAEFPEYVEPADEFPVDVPPPPTPTETAPKGAPRHKTWVKD